MRAPVAILSHAAGDGTVAERLARDLRRNDVEASHSEWEIRPGESLRRKIDEGIDGATHFLILLTPRSVASDWVQGELNAGLVTRIAVRCGLVPMLQGVSRDQVPAALRRRQWVWLDKYEKGVRRLIDCCHGVSAKGSLRAAPSPLRPLGRLRLSIHAQRVAAWINTHATDGHTRYSFEQDALTVGLGLAAEDVGMAAGELAAAGYVELHRDPGGGGPGFASLNPMATLFIETDPILRGWDPRKDARAVAEAMLSLGTEACHYVRLDAVDKVLGWGPRRLNPAAAYLGVYGHVVSDVGVGVSRYQYTGAMAVEKTRRFVESSGV